MSLVATWCYCSDGCWYEEPVWKGLDQNGLNIWFLCLDDDDPPEMVIRTDRAAIGTRAELNAMRPKLPWLRYISQVSPAGHRYFGGSFHKAVSCWTEFIQVPPPPEKYDSKSETRPSYMGCYYDLRKKRS